MNAEILQTGRERCREEIVVLEETQKADIQQNGDRQEGFPMSRVFRFSNVTRAVVIDER